ncbi:hypothetical protein Ga0100231_024080 [Opitutaceae bacterium TAV4]|nr:hypothetical protein Ga0100231_024080 [Opitutaceae bacterium TAV4]RRK00791.1 hypothetical protein Ga0100230_023655 [Opitutaceae bacterium TAV3]
MTADTNLKLLSLLEAVNAHIKQKFPALHVADHERFTKDTPRPAALTEIADFTPLDPAGDDGTERLCITLSFSTFVVYKGTGDERKNRIAVRALALRIAHHLRFQLLAGQPVSQPIITDVATDYLSAGGDNAQGANNAALVECQRIDWSVEGYVGEDIWQDEIIGETLVLGKPQITDEYFPNLSKP